MKKFFALAALLISGSVYAADKGMETTSGGVKVVVPGSQEEIIVTKEDINDMKKAFCGCLDAMVEAHDQDCDATRDADLDTK